MAGSVNRAGLPETGTCTAQRRGQGSKTAAGRQRTTAGRGAPTLTPRTACYGEGNSKTPPTHTPHAHLGKHSAQAASLPEASGIPAIRPRRAPPGSGQCPGSSTAKAGTHKSAGEHTVSQSKKHGPQKYCIKEQYLQRRSPCTMNSVSCTSLASRAVRNGCAVSGAGSEQPMPTAHGVRT